MIGIDWHDHERTILYIRYENNWTWQEYEQAMLSGHGMLRQVTHRVDIISHAVDPQSRKIRPGALVRWRSTLTLNPGNIGVFVHIPGDAFVKLIVNTFSALPGSPFAGKFWTAESFEQALDIIKRLRA